MIQFTIPFIRYLGLFPIKGIEKITFIRTNKINPNYKSVPLVQPITLVQFSINLSRTFMELEKLKNSPGKLKVQE